MMYAAFRALRLDGDPLEPTNTYATGTDFLDYLDGRTAHHGLPVPLADKLIEFYRKARAD